MSAESPVFSNPDVLAKPPGYSQVVEVPTGRLLFIAGQVAWDTNGDLVGAGDFAAQADQVYRNIVAAATSEGRAGKVVKLTAYVTDVANLAALREVRNRYFPPGPDAPASTLVQVAALFRPEFLIEVEAVAWLA